MNMILSSLSAAVFLPRLFRDLFDLCPSVRPFCVCVPGRSLSWGISCCLVCIICLCAACASVLFLRAFGVTGAGCTSAPPTERRAHFPLPLTKVNSGVFLTGCAAASLGYFCESPIAGHSHKASYSSAHQDENHKAATLQWMRLRFSSWRLLGYASFITPTYS